jgi:polygalacturonase
MIYNIMTFGGCGRRRHQRRHAFQKAIDACSASGGGTVLAPAGQVSMLHHPS